MSGPRPTVVITTPAWLQGDGVGHDVEGMARALVDQQYRVLVYSPLFQASAYESWRIDEATVREALQDPTTVLIHHHSIGCELTERLLKEAKARVRIMRYHNVTPPEFFEGYNDDWVRNCAEGRKATQDVVRHCTDYSVPSFYNARDLVHAGAPADSIFYLPYFHKLSDFDRVQPDESVMQQLRSDRRMKVLFLGRRVNNKGHLHLVRTIAAYAREFDREIVLHLVGAPDPSLRRYDDEIRAEIGKHGLEQNVVLHEKVSFASIVAFYKGCDAFLCISEHEGFCIPVIEAEYCGLPVVAYYRCGVPESLGPTQPWLTSLHYPEYARKLREIRTSSGYADQLSRAARGSVRSRFDIDAIRSRFLGWFASLTQQPADTGRKGGERPRVAFVVQRYGKDVAGGAEAFARMYAERLCEHFDITVVTTTSRTLDWENEMPSGESGANPRVLRFAPRQKRDHDLFWSTTEEAGSGRVAFEDWLVVHGPDAPEMADYLRAHAADFDLIVNWTYLFANVRYVAELATQTPRVCVPFFHDEPFLYIRGHGDVASRFDAYVYQTDAELQLAEHVGGIVDKPSILLGAGIEERIADAVRVEADPSPIDGPYVLYVGRIEKGKGVQDLLDHFQRFKAESRSALKLVIVGRLVDCEMPAHPDIVLTGFVSEREKFRLIKHAVALVNPSRLESFSLVLIESWALGRPVLVSSRCPATSGQVMRSGGGLAFANYREFAWALEHLESAPELATELGRNGQSFYEEHYRWRNILPRFRDFLEQVMDSGAQHAAPVRSAGNALAIA